MPKRLTQEQVDRYHEEGIVSPIPVLSTEQVNHYFEAYLDLERRFGRTPKAVELLLTHLHFDWAYELATLPAVLDAVEDVLGPNVLIWSSSIFPKKPHDPGYVSFHQDGTYWGLSATQVTTAWIALTPSLPENGCMRVVPRTHKHEIHPHKDTYDPANMLTRGQEIQVDIDEKDALDVVLQPGEMSLHHVSIIHGSGPSHSETRRIGFAPRYITPDVSQVGDRHPVILARGRDDYGHFEFMQGPPSFGSMEEAFAVHTGVAKKHLDALTKTQSAAKSEAAR